MLTKTRGGRSTGTGDERGGHASAESAAPADTMAPVSCQPTVHAANRGPPTATPQLDDQPWGVIFGYMFFRVVAVRLEALEDLKGRISQSPRRKAT